MTKLIIFDLDIVRAFVEEGIRLKNNTSKW